MIPLTVLLLGLLQLSSAAIQYQTCPKLWKKLGCRADLHHNLTLLLDDRNRNIVDWDRFGAYGHDLLCRCRQAAVAKGYKWFAVDSHGLCSVKLGDLASYLREFPLDDQAKCSGLMAQVPVAVPDGSNCINGRYRPFFYTIETSVPTPVGGAPVGGAPEEEIEEEEVIPIGSAPKKEKEEEVVSSCKTVADVVLAVDVSGSIKNEGFQQTVKFIKYFLDRFDFTDGTRIGIVTYDEKCQQILDWKASAEKGKQKMKEYCDSLTFTGGSTRTDLAINCIMEIIKKQKRPNVPITCAIMTDGYTWGGVGMVQHPADNLRAMGAKVISVGIGSGIDRDQLMGIAGGLEDNFLKIDSFSELTGPKFLNNLIGKSCR